MSDDVVPGMMRCAKCNFVLSRTVLFVQSGTAGAGGNETEPCPNGCGPLWPMSWRQRAEELEKICAGQVDRAVQAEARVEELCEFPRLKIAESPAKADLLNLLDELRAGVENGTIISLVAIPIHPDRQWTNRSAGELSMLQLSGLLGRIWLDATLSLT